MCKFTTDAIITESSDVATAHKVCANLACPIHHPKPQTDRDDTKWKAEQEKQRREAAIANTTGIRVLAAIAAAVPVRLMKRDLLFVAERLASLLDENRLTVLARQHGIKKAKDTDSIEKLFVAYLRRADESTLGCVLVEGSSCCPRRGITPRKFSAMQQGPIRWDTDAITLKVKQEFAAKEKARKADRPEPKPTKAKRAA